MIRFVLGGSHRIQRALPLLLVLIPVEPEGTAAETWRLGDREQPWRPQPVSLVLNVGPLFRPDYIWGGGNSVEVVVDDDGDGLIDEDPVNLVDDDGDGFFNEDPVNGRDDDGDGLIDEDGPDPQLDDDGDGLINEDGRMTGGLIFDPVLRDGYRRAPFFRDPPDYGDDDYDGRFNEDPVNGRDDDGDGLIDEDDRLAQPLPASWTRRVYAYDLPAGTDADFRAGLRFDYDAERDVFVAATSADSVFARPRSMTFNPTDWIRPIRLDSARNVVRLADDRFLSGEFGPLDPIRLFRGAVRVGDSGHGQVVDGNRFTARSFVQRGGGIGTDLGGLFWIDRVRYYPRPDFPDRTPATFRILFGGDEPRDFRSFLTSDGEVSVTFFAGRFLVPRQIDQKRPSMKDFRIDPPQRARSISLASDTREGEAWELAEAEAYGHGYGLEASYVSEIIDVGLERPRFRRYFEEGDLSRTRRFESIRTFDKNNNGRIEAGELASTELARQFDPDVAGTSVTWGRVRWRAVEEGESASVKVRVRAGTTLDTRIYLRRIAAGVVSPFIDRSLLLNWPEPGSRLDAITYVALNARRRVGLEALPYNGLGDADGMPGGWSQWSAPLDFAAGLIDENGGGGVLMPLPPLTRYIQLRFDFESTGDSGVSLDYIEFEFNSPFVGGGVAAEIFPDTTAQLGVPVSFQYVLRPEFSGTGDAGFNRIDITVPSADASVDGLIVDGLGWTALEPDVPAEVPPGERQAYRDSLRRTRAWLDDLKAIQPRTFACAVVADSASRRIKIRIKTSLLDARDFPPGQGRDIRIRLRTPVFSLLTEFQSWVWNDRVGDAASQQATQAGDAAEDLPSDGIVVKAASADGVLSLRAVESRLLTPNGDGVNDVAVFEVDLFLFTVKTEVDLEIYDLTGERIWSLQQLALTAGSQRLIWGGRDVTGRLAIPGLYIYRIHVDSDAGAREIIGTVAVVY